LEISSKNKDIIGILPNNELIFGESVIFELFIGFLFKETKVPMA